VSFFGLNIWYLIDCGIPLLIQKKRVEKECSTATQTILFLKNILNSIQLFCVECSKLWFFNSTTLCSRL